MPLRKLTLLICTIFVSALLLFIAVFHLGRRPLTDYDESIYASVAQEIVQSGKILETTWKGNVGLNRDELWVEKPPFLLYLLSLGYKVFGVSEVVSRIWSVFFGLLTIFVTALIAEKIYKSRLAGLISISIFLLSFQYLAALQLLQVDIVVGFFVALSLLFYLNAKTNPKYWYLVACSVGLGVMTKSVIGLLPGLPILLLSITEKDFSYLKSKHFYYALSLGLLIIFPWHILGVLYFGDRFIDQYFKYHLIDRFSKAIDGHISPWNFYLKIIWEHRLLSILTLLSLVYSAAKFRTKFGARFVLVTVVSILYFFSSAKTKFAPYILVIYPFLSLLVTGLVLAVYDKLKTRNQKLAISFIALFLISVSGLGVRFKLYKVNSEFYQKDEDAKNVGLFLKSNLQDRKLNFYSSIGTQPEVVFYSDRVVYMMRTLEYDENSLILSEHKIEQPNLKEIYSTPTLKIYEVQ